VGKRIATKSGSRKISNGNWVVNIVSGGKRILTKSGSRKNSNGVRCWWVHHGDDVKGNVLLSGDA
jgi:hypothetical protein